MKYEIYSYDDIGFKKVFNYKSWSIAYLNFIDELIVDNLKYVEAHHETDEAFILLNGNASIIIADNNLTPMSFKKVKLELEKVFVVKSDSYHTLILDEDAKILIIEENNTNDDNTSKIFLTKNDIIKIMDLK